MSAGKRQYWERCALLLWNGPDDRIVRDPRQTYVPERAEVAQARLRGAREADSAGTIARTPSLKRRECMESGPGDSTIGQ